MKGLVLLVSMLCLTILSNAQSKKYTDKDFAVSPVWITMIQDTAVNFFEAERAFNVYFQNHEKPEGEQEDIGEQPQNSKDAVFVSHDKSADYYKMRFEVKKYERWRQKMLPFVQTDGTILSPAQRLLIWESKQSHK